MAQIIKLNVNVDDSRLRSLEKRLQSGLAVNLNFDQFVKQSSLIAPLKIKLDVKSMIDALKKGLIDFFSVVNRQLDSQALIAPLKNDAIDVLKTLKTSVLALGAGVYAGFAKIQLSKALDTRGVIDFFSKSGDFFSVITDAVSVVTAKIDEVFAITSRVVQQFSPFLGDVFSIFSWLSTTTFASLTNVLELFNRIDLTRFLQFFGLTSNFLTITSSLLNGVAKTLGLSFSAAIVGKLFGEVKTIYGYVFERSPKVTDSINGIIYVFNSFYQIFTVRISTFADKVKTGIGVVSTFASAFFGLPGIVTAAFASFGLTSFFGVISERLTRFKLSVGAALGSSRAQILLIALDLKNLALTVLPKIIKFIDSPNGINFFKNVVNAVRDIATLTPALVNTLPRAEEQVKKISKQSNSFFDIVKKITGTVTSLFSKKPPLETLTKVSSLSAAVAEKALVLVGTEGKISTLSRSISTLFPGTKKIDAKSVSVESVPANTIASLKEFKTQVLNIRDALGKAQFKKITGVTGAFAQPYLGNFESLKGLSKKLSATEEEKKIKKLQSAVGELTKFVLNLNTAYVKLNDPKNLEKLSKGGIDKQGISRVLIDSEKVLQQVISSFASPKIKLSESGKRIVEQLYLGIKSQTQKMAEAGNTIASRFMAFFPRSPAREGPLQGLSASGRKIALQISHGILSGINSIRQPIDDTFKNINYSERLGISVASVESLGFALKSVGSDFSELEYFASRALSNLDDLGGIGIDVEKVKVSQDQLEAVIFSVSELLQNTQVGTKEYFAILEKIGLTSTSNLINFFKRGVNEVARLKNVGTEIGIITGDQLLRTARETKETETTFDALIGSLKTAFSLELAPSIDHVLQSIIGLFTSADTRGVTFVTKIKAVFTAVSSIIVSVSNVFVSLIKLIFDKPEQGFKITKKVFGAISDLMIVLLGNLDVEIYEFIVKTLAFIQASVLAFFSVLSSIALKTIGLLGKQAVYAFAESVIKPIVADGKNTLRDILVGFRIISDETIREWQDGFMLVRNEITEAKDALVKNTTASLVQDIKKDTEDALVAANDLLNSYSTLKKRTSFADLQIGAELRMIFGDLQNAVKGTDLQKPVDDLIQTLKAVPETYDQAINKQVQLNEKIKAGTKETVDAIKNTIKPSNEIVLKSAEDLARKQTDMQVDSLEKTTDVFEKLYESSGQKAKEFFYISKSVAIATATMKGSLAVINALADTDIPYTLRVVNAAVTAAQVTTQIGQMVAQTIGFNKGGLVPGTGPNKDSITARLTPGEFVLPRMSVAAYGKDMLESLRNLTFPISHFRPTRPALPTPKIPAFNSGGMVGGQSKAQQKQEITIVNYIDPALFEQYLVSSKGQNTIVNIMGINQGKLKRIFV